MREGEAIFDDLRGAWESQIGAAEMIVLESQLTTLVGHDRVLDHAPGWVSQDQD